MKTVLLTCGRGVYALTLARAFCAAGCRVLVAESWSYCASRFSNAVDRYFHVPAPATETEEWVAALLRIVDAEAVDLIVPVYEEVFHLAKALDGCPCPPRIFASDFQTLITLHNKWLFN